MKGKHATNNGEKSKGTLAEKNTNGKDGEKSKGKPGHKNKDGADKLKGKDRNKS